MTILESVTVNLGSRSYPIHIGQGLLAHIKEHLPFNPAGRTLFVLADYNIENTYAEMLAEGLKKAGAAQVHIRSVPPGEASKSWKQLESVLSWILDNKADRQSVLFAVGGGVTGDLGGFAAAIALRGIPFVQVPTTLLAQVDSSVGGKTGINTPQGKNMVGAFHQPAAVLCDLDTLETLPRRELLAGYAEIAKYGLINDPEFFIWLESQGTKVCALEPQVLAKAIETACRKKAEIVAQDETEKGVRALLNLGHTFGHALEAAAGYDGSLLHGEAVAIGMVLAFRLSVRLGLCPEADEARVEKHLAAMGLPVRPSFSDIDKIMAFMTHDKKVTDGKVVFILAHGIGKAVVSKNIDLKDAKQIIAESMKGK